MANFKTHALGAALVSGVAATGLAMSGSYDAQQVLGLFGLGAVGGLLPDVDSDHSIPIRIAFNVLSVIAGFLVVFHFAGRLSLVELVLLGLASFALVRFGVFSVFTKFTIHRGLIHSIPAGVIAGMVTAIIAVEVFGSSAIHAWLAASFVCGGFLVHLILDEIYAVDLLGIRVKRSFGTALNFGSFNNPFGTAGLYVALFALLLVVPPWQHFIQLALEPATYQPLIQRLLPHGGWFQGLLGV